MTSLLHQNGQQAPHIAETEPTVPDAEEVGTALGGHCTSSSSPEDYEDIFKMF